MGKEIKSTIRKLEEKISRQIKARINRDIKKIIESEDNYQSKNTLMKLNHT